MTSTGFRRTVFVVAAMTILAGASQLLLELAIARNFGRGLDVDAFYLAFLLPSVAVNIFAGGTIFGAFSPAYARVIDASGSTAGREFLGQAVVVLFAWLTIVSVGILMAYPLLWIEGAPLEGSPARELALTMFSLLLPLLTLNGLSSLLASALGVHGHHAAASFAPGLVPMTAVVVVALMHATLGIRALVLGLILGGVTQLIFLLVCAYRGGLLVFNLTPALGRNFVSQYAWMLGAAALLAGIMITDQIMAGKLAPGSVATFNFGTRLIAMLLAFATVVISNAAVPHFSRLVLNMEGNAVWNALTRHLLIVAAAGTVIALAVAALSLPIVQLVFEHGAFKSSDSLAVAQFQAVYALHIPFYLTGVIGWRMLNALQRNEVLLLIAAMCCGLNVVTNLVAVPSFGLLGIAGGKALVFGIWAAGIMLALRRELVHKVQTDGLGEGAASAVRPNRTQR
jgi:putative peptidoglycan lipid II flippase